MPVVTRIKVKVKKTEKNRSIRKYWNITLKENFPVEVRNRYNRLKDEVEGDGVQRLDCFTKGSDGYSGSYHLKMKKKKR